MCLRPSRVAPERSSAGRASGPAGTRLRRDRTGRCTRDSRLRFVAGRGSPITWLRRFRGVLGRDRCVMIAWASQQAGTRRQMTGPGTRSCRSEAHTRRQRLFFRSGASVLLLLAASACGSPPAWDAGVRDVGADVGDIGVRDGADRDHACDPGGHFDCIAGAFCIGGGVWETLSGVRNVCHPDDYVRWPWICTSSPLPPPPADLSSPHSAPAYACASSECGLAGSLIADERYQGCIADLVSSRSATPARAEPLLRLFCTEGLPHRVGAPCATDDDCRPAAEGISRLTCDRTSRACATAARPPRPAGFGEQCGATYGASGVGSVIATPSCAVCQVTIRVTAVGNCVAQACTMPCDYDEDCPDSAVCLCDGGMRYCALVRDRRTWAGRTEWLRCPSFDAGVEDGGSDAMALDP